MALKTNDSEPKTARAAPAYEWDSDTALARIKEISQNARSTWFGLLALMTFVLVTLLGVQDIDFFGYGRFTQLPLVNVQVPTELFFWAGPPLAAASYAYFHFYLLRLWDALGRAPARHQGDPFSEHVYPWLLTDAALRRRPDAAAKRRALGKIAALTSLLITWIFGLIVLFFAWWRSLVAHDPALSVLTLACLLFAATAGMTSWVMLGRRVERKVSGPFARHVWRGWRKRGGRRVVIFLALVTLLKTWSGHPGVKFDYPFNDEENIRITVTSTILTDAIDITRPRTLAGVTLPEFDLPENNLMANADLTAASITIRPNNWLPRTIAEREARKEWCNRQNLTWDLCIKQPVEPHQDSLRRVWCKNHLGIIERTLCEAHFTKRDDAFATEWKERRNAYLADLKKPDLKSRDLRAASLGSAFLPGVDLRASQLEGANLNSAQMEEVDLRGAWLEGADLRGAQLEGADLRQARLKGADLRGSRLEGADFRKAKLEEADLRQTHLEGAKFRGARLSGADLAKAIAKGVDLSQLSLVGATLSEARLEGANLQGARLENAQLLYSQLTEANLAGAQLAGADLFGASLDKANLSRTQLRGAILIEARLVSANLHDSRMEDADLREAKLQRADLSKARLENTNLIYARLDGANLLGANLKGAFLGGASLEGANLRWTDFQAAEFSSATIGYSTLGSANLTGVKNLTQEMLENAVGNADTILPIVDGEPLYVWSCWKRRPRNFNWLIAMQAPKERDELRNRWQCGSEDRKKTGRTAED